MMPSTHIGPPSLPSTDFMLGQMWSTLGHLSSEQEELWEEFEKQKSRHNDLKERVEMIDRRWRSLLAFMTAITMIAANLVDKDGIELLGRAVELLK